MTKFGTVMPKWTRNPLAVKNWNFLKSKRRRVGMLKTVELQNSFEHLDEI